MIKITVVVSPLLHRNTEPPRPPEKCNLSQKHKIKRKSILEHGFSRDNVQNTFTNRA